MTLSQPQRPTGAPITDPAWPLAFPLPASDAATAEILTAFAHVVTLILTRHSDTGHEPPASPPGMLTVTQTAALLGLSRTTVIRKADTGELPCIIVARGPRQKMRRFPRAMIEHLAAHGGHTAQADLKACTALWLATNRSVDGTSAGLGGKR